MTSVVLSAAKQREPRLGNGDIHENPVVRARAGHRRRGSAHRSNIARHGGACDGPNAADAAQLARALAAPSPRGTFHCLTSVTDMSPNADGHPVRCAWTSPTSWKFVPSVAPEPGAASPSNLHSSRREVRRPGVRLFMSGWLALPSPSGAERRQLARRRAGADVRPAHGVRQLRHHRRGRAA
jgi:hypothetical protein